MPEITQTLLLFLVMGGAALAVGWRLGRTTPPAKPDEPADSPGDTPAKDAEDDSATSASKSDDAPAPEGDSKKKKKKEKKGTKEKPKDILALAESLSDEHSRAPTPRTFLESEKFQKALATLNEQELSADHLLGFVANDSVVVAVLAMSAGRPEGLDVERLRKRLIEALQAPSLLVRTVALQTLEDCAADDDRLIGPVVGRLDCDWENPASRELLEEFLRRRLTFQNESLEIASELKHCSSWELSNAEDVVRALPQDLRDPLLSSLTKARNKAGDFAEFLRSFGTILPPVATQLEDGSPLVATPALEKAADQIARNLTRSDRARPVLLSGRQGVGKSALAMLVAKRLQEEGYLIFRAGATDLQSGQCYIGQLEERVREFVELLRTRKILWIAESFH